MGRAKPLLDDLQYHTVAGRGRLLRFLARRSKETPARRVWHVALHATLGVLGFNGIGEQEIGARRVVLHRGRAPLCAHRIAHSDLRSRCTRHTTRPLLTGISSARGELGRRDASHSNGGCVGMLWSTARQRTQHTKTPTIGVRTWIEATVLVASWLFALYYCAVVIVLHISEAKRDVKPLILSPPSKCTTLRCIAAASKYILCAHMCSDAIATQRDACCAALLWHMDIELVHNTTCA